VKDIFFPRRMWRRQGSLARRYDVVIVGGGVQGLAIAYYLAKHHGITNIAVLEQSYIGSGGSGRNTAIIRSNYRTVEAARFYQASLELFEGLSAELDFNTLFTQRGVLTLAHSERAMITMTERASVNRLLGIDTRIVGLDEIGELCPQLDLSRRKIWPIIGAMWHPRGGIIRHDAVVWGYARAADRLGVEIHQGVRVTGFGRENGRVTSVETTQGTIDCGTVISAVAGWSSELCGLAGFRLPITTHILQAFVTESVRRFLDPTVVSSQMRIYIHQTTRGELVAGTEVEPYTTYKGAGTLGFLETASAAMLELFPQLGHLDILRTWTGLCDITPDYSPIVGRGELENFFLTAGWGTYGFKATPIVATAVAELVATGRTHELIAPFGLERFETDLLVSETASASMSH
jgi:sarcosine oxidase, subunit beta